MNPVRLYHFTSKIHLPRILESGFLKVVESNMSKTRLRAGPDVVWLTKSAEVQSHRGWSAGSSADKTEIRFEVDIPAREAHRWRDWARSRGIASEWMAALAAVGGSGTWYVVLRPIPAAEWVEIIDTSTGEPLEARRDP